MGPLKRKTSTVKLGEKWKISLECFSLSQHFERAIEHETLAVHKHLYVVTKSKSMSGRKKSTKKRLSDIVDEATKSDQENEKDEDAKEQQLTDNEKKQEEEKKARFPIAPDGYLPNSVIRKIIKPPADTLATSHNTEEPWRLKPVPKTDSHNQPGTLSRLSDYDVTLYLSDHESVVGVDPSDILTQVRKQFINLHQIYLFSVQTSMSNPVDEADDRTQDYDEMTAVQAHHMSRESTSIPIPGREQSSTGQQNLLTSEATTLSKGRPLLSTMSHHATSAISEEADSGMELLQHIADEPWYPATMDHTMIGVVDAFTAIMDNVTSVDYKQICDYIIQIHQEIGYPDQLSDRIADKLAAGLFSPVTDKRMDALRAIDELGLKKRSILKEILTMLTDPTISKEAKDEEMIESQNTGDDMSVLPESTQDQLVETWLEGTKGVVKDLSGLYREDSHSSRKNSRNRKLSNSSNHSNISRDSNHSRKSNKSNDSQHTDVDYDSDVSSLTSSDNRSGNTQFHNSYSVSVGDIKDQMAREYSETRVPPATRANTMTSLLSDGPRPPENGHGQMSARNRWRSSVRRHLLQGQHTKTLSRIPSASSHKQNTVLEASSLHVKSMPALVHAVIDGSEINSASVAPQGEEGVEERSPDHKTIAWGEHESIQSGKRSSDEQDGMDPEYLGEEMMLGQPKDDKNSEESNGSQNSRKETRNAATRASSHDSGIQNVIRSQVNNSENSHSRSGDEKVDVSPAEANSAAASRVSGNDREELDEEAEYLSHNDHTEKGVVLDDTRSEDGVEAAAKRIVRLLALPIPTEEMNTLCPMEMKIYKSGRSTPKENMINKLSNKLTPDNALMYKIYDSQRQTIIPSPEKSAKITRFEDNLQSVAERVAEDDSGFGQEIDSSSYSHEKSSVVRTGTRNLSPVQGSDDENNEDVIQQETDTEDWRICFDRAKKQKEQSKLPGPDVPKLTREPINLPPIRYLGDDVEMVTGDTGQRLLHSISVKPKRQDSAGSMESGKSQKHKIHSLPGRLGTNTTRDGYSKYGILTMQWTTSTPACGHDCQRYLLHHYNKHRMRTSESNGITATKFQIYNLQVTSDISSPETCSRSASSNTKFLPALVSNPEPLYEWGQPVAPFGEVKSISGNCPATRESKHYCDYSRLLKKRMHDHISATELGQIYLPELVKKGLKPLSRTILQTGANS
ncbi:hypothetical protein LSH36_263g01041 [Paralvinella palmiformis]|uniref:Uncharacterized protein n=1 Tax=Paralvinella palmiformis TaxID=53620 RepID=A0AAD9JK06_9ANNE|nr:hypothetical protein LSH36_263g01041 [Paralvinella palmiformis]